MSKPREVYPDAYSYLIRKAARSRIVNEAAAAVVGVDVLHMSSSQKHMWPAPLLSIMHTWSTMNRLICSCEVHVLRTTSYAENENEQKSNVSKIRTR